VFYTSGLLVFVFHKIDVSQSVHHVCWKGKSILLILEIFAIPRMVKSVIRLRLRQQTRFYSQASLYGIYGIHGGICSCSSPISWILPYNYHSKILPYSRITNAV